LRTQLLCTFAHKKDLDLIADYIATSYDVSEKRMFVFSDADNKNDLYITYNVESSNFKRTPNTISIHRKKDSNTLYTVNALNVVIKNSNNGVLDKTFMVDWSNYENTLLLTNGDELRRVDLVLMKRIDI
jgi:hypothetical protein